MTTVLRHETEVKDLLADAKNKKGIYLTTGEYSHYDELHGYIYILYGEGLVYQGWFGANGNPHLKRVTR